jgi:hypothetical protein
VPFGWTCRTLAGGSSVEVLFNRSLVVPVVLDLKALG